MAKENQAGLSNLYQKVVCAHSHHFVSVVVIFFSRVCLLPWLNKMATMPSYIESIIVAICLHFCYMQFTSIYSTVPSRTCLLQFTSIYSTVPIRTYCNSPRFSQLSQLGQLSRTLKIALLCFYYEGNRLLFALYFDYWQCKCRVINSHMNT